MLFRTSDLTRMREVWLNITPGDWLLVGVGFFMGIVVWYMFNRKVVRNLVQAFKSTGMSDNRIGLIKGVIGLLVMVPNVALIYLCELSWNFFLFAFALSGLLAGAWVLFPAD